MADHVDVLGCDFLTVRDGKIVRKNSFRKQRLTRRMKFAQYRVASRSSGKSRRPRTNLRTGGPCADDRARLMCAHSSLSDWATLVRATRDPMRKPRAMATTSVRSVDDVIAATGRRASVATPIPWVVASQTDRAAKHAKGETDRAGDGGDEDALPDDGPTRLPRGEPQAAQCGQLTTTTLPSGNEHVGQRRQGEQRGEHRKGARERTQSRQACHFTWAARIAVLRELARKAPPQITRHGGHAVPGSDLDGDLGRRRLADVTMETDDREAEGVVEVAVVVLREERDPDDAHLSSCWPSSDHQCTGRWPPG